MDIYIGIPQSKLQKFCSISRWKAPRVPLQVILTAAFHLYSLLNGILFFSMEILSVSPFLAEQIQPMGLVRIMELSWG